MPEVNMQALYRPYECEGAMLDDTLAWIHREGKKLDFPSVVVEAAINETFLEMATGLEFPTDGTGTPSKRPNAAMNFYLREKMFKLGQNFRKEYRILMEKSLNDKIKLYNFKKRSRWTNWTKSPIYRLFKRGS